MASALLWHGAWGQPQCKGEAGSAEATQHNVRDPLGSPQAGSDPHLVQLRSGAGAVKQEAAEGAVDAVAEVIHEALLAATLFLWRGAGRGFGGLGHTGGPVPPSHLPSELGCSTGTSSLAVMLAAKVKAEVT